MSVNESLSEELDKSYDSSDLADTITEKEEKSINLPEENIIPKKRRISKISLKLEEMKDKINEIKENDFDASTDDIDLDLDEIPYFSKSNEYLKKENVFSKFDIIFSFLFEQKEFSVSIESDIFNTNKKNVQDLIKNIINKINEKNIIIQKDKIKYILSLKDRDDTDFINSNYELRTYNKNECIVYPFDLLLSDIKVTKINFVSKNYLNMMIRKL